MIKNKILHFFYTSDRSTLIGIFFLLFFLIIAVKMFSYTVSNYDFYKDLADKQQIGTVTVPVTRGTIYSSTDGGTVFGTSVNLYDIAIDPQVTGDKLKLTLFLTDIVYKEICPDSQGRNDCEQKLRRFLGAGDDFEFIFDTDTIKEQITEVISERVYRKRVTSVFVDQELEQEQIEQLSTLGLPGLYPSGNFLYMNPEEIQNSDTTSLEVAKILGTNQEKMKHLMRKRDVRYVPILNRLSIDTSEYIKQYLDEERQAIKKSLIDRDKSIGGFIILTPNPNRYYPEQDVASQLIGFVDKQAQGNYGIEGYFNEVLQGNNGKIVSRKDIQGRIIDPINLDQSDIRGEGVKVYTTVDRNIQKKAEQILADGVERYRANKGTMVILEPDTGRVLALANAPSYDLNDFSSVYEIERVTFGKYPDPAIDLLGFPVFVVDSEKGDPFYYDGKQILLRRASREEVADPALVKYKYKNDFGPLLYSNDAISALYEPGSIMKSITVAVGIDTGEISRWGMYNDIGKVTIGRFEIENDSDKCFGYHSFAHALNYSCNIGMIRIVQRLGKVLFRQYLKDFGFSSPTGITLSGETYVELPTLNNWSDTKFLTNSYGLGMSTTPLQMATAYGALANGGVYIKPRVIDALEFPDGRRVEYKPEKERRVIKESTSQTMTSMLVAGINSGVARNGGVEGYALAGKTGTSQIPYRGRYEEGIGSTVASFAGYGPAEDPQFVIIVKLDRPRANPYGGQTSAYLFQEMSEYLLQYYGIPKREK
ncbi:penicillin-binding protein 2 [Candidatus Gracilibacteria bacterium]|nr:penicillin-binding protein 2 [Candidatus Gracilibacteria bacterium]